ncbi:hypothetical protein [Burkholderia vietnamiensis]|uniref:hypothetical protein n=1 Tax=Burkholderia vietnamiensis TaxID=60552 RepID=UPI001CF19AE8|nr:hypothetical protein [Burkholderia vietnamiensis]MCA8448984.1 hypothetical protein [Burkholderia vietnamiensis]
MSTTEIRSEVMGLRYTPTEVALITRQALAEGKKPTEWLHDVGLNAARERNLIRDGIEAVSEEARVGFINLAEQISTGTNDQVKRGIDEIGASVRSSVATVVQDVTAREVQKSIGDLPVTMQAYVGQVAREAATSAVDKAMGTIRESQENLRTEIKAYLQGLIDLMSGTKAVADPVGGNNRAVGGDKATPAERQKDWMS